MSYVIRIEGLAFNQPRPGGSSSPFDGEYLAEYDPERDGTDPNGESMIAHIVTTPNPEDALHFDTGPDATECYRQVCQRNPTRPDGKPNRPLTAFTVAILPEEQL